MPSLINYPLNQAKLLIRIVILVLILIIEASNKQHKTANFA